MSRSWSYHKAGVDIDAADAAKRQMAKTLATPDPRVINSVGAFASLLQGAFPGYEQPVFVMKTEEPGSKQKLAFEHGHVDSICYDLINHLINDIVVMGARPLYVQDCILCGKLDNVTDRAILLDQKPELMTTLVGDQPFLDAILVPHKCYYRALQGVFDLPGLHGMAHITGGGIQGNLSRILPSRVNAIIDLGRLQPPPLFRVIQLAGNVEEADMLRTFNNGVGMAIVVQAKDADSLKAHLRANECPCYQIGEITEGEGQVLYKGKLIF